MVWRFLLALVFLLLAGCGQPATTNRIFSKRSAATAIVPAGQPLSVDISQLLQAPEAYEGTLVRIQGEFRRAPVIVCDGITRFSPASWRLAQGELVISAGGFEDLVNTLLPPGLGITVDGVWRFWRGPVGCGKDAPLQSVWYLAVVNIVSPSPVARVTLTPPGAAPPETPQATVEGPQETTTPVGPPPIGTPLTEPSPTSGPPTSPPVSQPTNTPRPSPTLSASPTEGLEGESTGEPTGTLTPSATADGTAVASATATSQSNVTATPTATPGITSTPGGTVVDKGDIGYQDLRGSRLARNERNSWEFPVEAGDVITISVAARNGTDIALVVLDPAGNRLVEQNDSPAGQIETIEGLDTQSTGNYRLVISEASASETYYSLLLLNNNYSDYYNFIFAGLLSYGSSVTTNMAEDTDQFWFFFGNSQDVVSINVAPTDQSDVFFDIFGPEGDLLQDSVDAAAGGGSEQLLNYVLPDNGMYGIRVGEIEYAPSNFTILVSRN